MSEQHVYIIGSKGIPAKYGGFETFVEKLTENQTDSNIKYHIACMYDNSEKSGITTERFQYNNADCFNIKIPNIGPAKAIVYDINALKYAVNLARVNEDKQPIFYVLACRIGPFISRIKKEIKLLNGKLYVNPDGHEWMRQKWSYPVRKYWKHSERLMVKAADLLICDSKNIEKYIQKEYKEYRPATRYIAYGTDLSSSKLSPESSSVREWFNNHEALEKNYYLVVGRFVPENNYETMIREFMSSNTKRDFILITNVSDNNFFEKLKKATHFENDLRIKFVGTVYNQELLKYLRENAFAYLHGHEVGGTNPSLLEALGASCINLLFDVGFNREVALNSALYWTKETGNLSNLINYVDSSDLEQFVELGNIAKSRMKDKFSWTLIRDQYTSLFSEKDK